MRKTNTRNRIVSILLALVMLLTMVPITGVTALAAGIPDPTAVSVDGGKFFQKPSKLYYKNGNGSDNFTGTSSDYNAHYDPNTGTLTLQGYEGGSITLGGAIQRDLTIKLIGNNKISVNGDQGIVATSRECNITITADSGSSGKLTIDVTSDSGNVVGIGNNIATGATQGNVTINGHADVIINATTNAKNWNCWGICAGEVVIEDHAKAAITVKAPNNTGGDFVYGIFAQKNVTINTAGEITVDASNAATVDGTGDRVYSIGVKSMDTLTLTKVGGMTVKWNNNLGMYGCPLSPSASFDSTAYDNHVDKTNCIATYTPKSTTPTTYTVSFDANGGTGTMADVTGISGEYTLPANGFTAPAGKQFKAWSVGGVEKAAGDKITVNANTTVTAVWEAIEYNVTVTGGTASVGAGTPITKATMGTTVTLTANAAPSGKVFDKWEVVSGGITLADANSATTTFTMPASAVSVKATYKNAPHTHTYNQETVKPEALKTPADCTSNAVYFKSCSCGAISTTDTFVAMDTALGHAYGSDWKYDSTNHWHECSRCHNKGDIAAHSAGGWIVDTPATATTAGTKHKECTVCKKFLETAPIPATGTATGGSHTHSYGTDWKYDDTKHWHECNCGDKKDEAAHSFKWVVDKEATATAEGAKHEECKTCGYKRPAVEIPATGSSHTNSSVYVGMTYTAGNLIYQITSIDTETLGQAKVIGVVAAKKDKITKVTIPNRADCKGYGLNVTTIGNNAFADCKALKKLTIGNKVTVIGKNAFKDCLKLETVVIGKAVKTISSKAFIGDNKIKEITFKGDKLKTVKKDAFSKKAKKNIKSKKTKLKGNKKAIKLFKKKLK